MATRRNKDKEIEELKARNTYLENKNKIFTSWNNMSDRERLILVLLWVVVIILIAFIVTLSVTNTTKNPMETKEDYERIIGTLDDRDWKVSESTLRSLQTLIPQTKGEASTTLKDDRISQILCGQQCVLGSNNPSGDRIRPQSYRTDKNEA